MALLKQMKWFIQDHVMVYLKNKFYGVKSVYDPDDILTGLKYIDTVTLKDGSIFKASKNLRLVMEDVILGYDWSDLREEDILLDLGAHIGSFTIPASRKVKHVFAVEPLYTEELQENLKLNNISNVTVIPYAIGENGTISISFQGKERKEIPTRSFKEMLVMCGGKIDFLKCDCEGGEWYINKNDLAGIRRIEMEVHPNMTPTEKSNPELIPYIIKNWETKKNVTYSTYILHAKTSSPQ